MKGLNVAIRNAGDGISLAQTAEGALGAVTDSLQRIRELALQSSNATNSDSDRQALNAEAQQLIDEISRVSEQTNFNGRKLLDGTFNASVQIGTNAGETVAFGVGKVTADRLGGGVTAGVSAIGSDNGIANGDLIINGVAIGPSKSADDTASTTNRAASAIAKVAAINRSSSETGVVAQVNENRAAGTAQVGAQLTGSVTINGVQIGLGTSGVNTSADREATVSAINSRSQQTGVVAFDTGNDSSGVELTAADGRNISISFSTLTAAATGLAAAGTYEGGFTLTSNNGGAVTIVEGGDGTGNGNLSNAGLVAGTYDSSSASVSTVARTSVSGAPTNGVNGLTVSANVTFLASSAAAVTNATGNAAGFDFSPTLAAAVNTASGAPASFDFSSNNVTFTVSDGTNSATVSLTTDVSDISGLVTAVNSALGGGSPGAVAITASNSSGALRFTSTATGSAAAVTLGGLSALETGLLGGGLVNGTTNGSTTSQAASFDVSDGTTTTTVTLNTNLANIAGVVTAINTQLGTGGTAVTASNNSGALRFTSTATGSTATTTLSAVNARATSQLALANATDTGESQNNTLSVVTDGGAAVNITLTGSNQTAAQILTQIQTGLSGATTASQTAGVFEFTSASTGSSSTVALSGNFLTANGANVQAGTQVNGGISDITTLSSGDLVVNNVAITAARESDDTASDRVANSSSAAGSGIATAAAINRASAQTGVSARVNATVVTGGTSTTAATSGDSGVIYINRVATTTVTATGDLATDRGAAINAINAISGRTGVLATDNGASITLTAGDGRNLSVAIDSADSGFGAGIGLDAAQAGIAQGDITGNTTTYAALAETTYSTVTLSSARAITVAGGNNGATGVSDIGFRQGTYGGATDGQFLTEVDISSLDGAQKALKAIDNALDSVNRERANLGAIQNRLDSTISTLAINAENTSAANSRIRDADFAKESAELSRTQVLQQAVISILAQANAQPQLVLSLLR